MVLPGVHTKLPNHIKNLTGLRKGILRIAGRTLLNLSLNSHSGTWNNVGQNIRQEMKFSFAEGTDFD
jgi:hypothetical protein